MASKPIFLRPSHRFRAEIVAEAERNGMALQEYVLACVSYAMRRGERVHMYREVHLTPGEGQSLDSMLEWLAARRPMVADLAAESGLFSPALRSTMRKVLKPHQLRRLEAVVLKGQTLEETGHAEGVSRQAVHASIQDACARLAANREFLEVLCAHFPDAELTPDTLTRALEVRRAR